MARLAVFTICLSMLPAMAAAQGQSRFEITGSAAATRVFRVEDESFGTKFNPGAGFEWRAWPRLGLGVEISRVTGLEPREVTCGGLPGVTCVGTGRDGVLSTTVLSMTAAWYFGNGAIQPYLIGGADVMRSRTVSSITFGSGDVRTIVEAEEAGTGTGVTAGIGVRVPVGRRVVLRPEWRVYDGSLLGSANLSAMRTSVGVSYSF